MKKEELIKENEKLQRKVEILSNERDYLRKLRENDTKRLIVGTVGDILFIALIIMLISNSIITTNENRRTRDMINKAEACVEINDDIYCKLEVKND